MISLVNSLSHTFLKENTKIGQNLQLKKDLDISDINIPVFMN